MPELKIAIGSIRYSLSCKEEEQESIEQIAKRINRKINLLSLQVGRVDEKILLTILLLINTKKTGGINSGNFEENMVNILKILSPLLYSKENQSFEEKLIVANIVKENELKQMEISGAIVNSEEENHDNQENGMDEEKHYKEMVDLVDVVAKYIEQIKVV